MRKMYLLLSLALLLCSVNDAWGRLRKKNPQPTEKGIDSPRDGMMIAFNRLAWNEQGSEANLWLCAGKDENEISCLTLSSVMTEPVKNNQGWILEASDEVIEEGIQSFYLKNLKTGAYLYFVNGSEDPEWDDAYLYLGEKSDAKSFIIVSSRQGALLMGIEETDFGDRGGVLKDGDWMIMAKVDEEYRSINTYMGTNGQGFMGVYTDYAAWYTAYEVEYYESMIENLQEVLEEMPEMNVKGGMNPGCYPQALVDEYKEARKNVFALTQQIEEPTKDVADAAIERLRQAEAAIKAASRVALTTGYYRIVNANPKFEECQSIRYAMTTNKNNVPVWGALGSTEEREVWYITALEGNKVTIQNVGNALYFIGPEAAKAVSLVDIMSEESKGDMTITFFDNASSARIQHNGGLDFFADRHGNGTGTGGNIVLWYGEASNAAAWFIEAVPAEDIALYDAVLQQNKLALEFNELLDTATKKYNIAAVYNKTGDGLITAVDQLSSNADHNALSVYQEGQGLPGLIDGDVHTFFLSLWRSDVEGAPDAYHNLTVDLKQPLNKMAFTMTARRYTLGTNYETDKTDFIELGNLNNRPTEIVLYGAKAGADPAQAESWKKLQTITGLPNSKDKPANDEELTFTTSGCSLFDDYQYLRFEVTKTNNGGSIWVNGNLYPFFTMAEFQVYNVESDPNCQLIALGEVGKAFEEACKKALSVETPTQQDIDDLRQAIYDFENTRNIDLRISDAGFATLMLPYEAALPEGVKAYTTSQAGETLANGCRVLTLVEADALQANTPYIIEGTPGTYTFSGAVTNTQDTYTNGWLTGTFVGTQAQAGTYVLQNNNGITGFYRVAAGKEPQVGANRAWLSVPTEEGGVAEVTAFVFGDDSATGIEGVDASDRRVDVYTLEGVRVRTDVRMSEALKALPRGVYVVNGKKTVK
jgi:hypothetical protein